MPTLEFYRGGRSLKPRTREVKLDPTTGLVLPKRGISVFSSPDNLGRFGGPYRLTQVPPELQIVQQGQNLNHFEVVPAFPMTMTEYEDALNRIVLVPA